jgi:hypothetical protein
MYIEWWGQQQEIAMTNESKFEVALHVARTSANQITQLLSNYGETYGDDIRNELRTAMRSLNEADTKLRVKLLELSKKKG